MHNKRISVPIIIGIILIILYLALIIFSLCSFFLISNESQWADILFTALTSLVGFFSLALTVYSTYVLIIEIRNGAFCTKRMVRKGAQELARIIIAFNPSTIIFIAGNSEKLFNEYISKYISFTKTIISLPATLRYNNPPVTSTYIMTNKFFIDVEDIAKLTSTDRVVIFDDITKTGETIKLLKDYIIDTFKINKSHIITCGFITDQYGYAHSAEPAFYYKKAKIKDNYRFPWINK